MKIAQVSFDDLVASFAGVLVTEGEKWSTLYLQNEIVHVDAFPIDQLVDPTGCGDAYRGGLLRGLRHEFDWAHAMQVGSYMASLCIQSEGTMEHAV
jgi:adenosine kinase